VLEQMKRCLEAAGSSFERVVKCNIYCTDAARFDEYNEVLHATFPRARPRASSCAFRFFRGRSTSRSIASRWS